MGEPGPEQLAQGRYRLSEVLGRGGMATVYRAWDQLLEVERAVKVLDLGVRSPSLRRRFLDEARMMAKLRHPNLVTVYDVGADQPAFMVMEVLPGSLNGWLRRHGPMPPRLACEAVSQVLGGLAHVHAAGIVHRDVKPHNVLVDADGTPKLTDFGIARLNDSSMTRTGSVMGTFAYMPPEQREDAKRVDHRADLYASGALLYALVTNREPLDLHATEGHTEAFRGVPPALVDLIRRSCRWAPEDRFADAEQMRAALDQLLELLPQDPPGTPPLQDCLAMPAGTVAEEDDSWGPASPAPPAQTLTPAPSDTVDEEASGLTEAPLEPVREPPWKLGLVGVVGLIVVGLAAWQPWQTPEPVARPQPVEPPPLVEAVPEPEPEPVVEAAAEVQPEAEAPPKVLVDEQPPPVRESKPEVVPEPEPELPEIVHGVVNSYPPSRVTLDGRELPNFPYRGDLPAGEHTLVFTTDDGRSHTAVVDIGPDFVYCWDHDRKRECP